LETLATDSKVTDHWRKREEKSLSSIFVSIFFEFVEFCGATSLSCSVNTVVHACIE
jgi:hypothetical protein